VRHATMNRPKRRLARRGLMPIVRREDQSVVTQPTRKQLVGKLGHQAQPAARCWPTPLRRRATPDLGRIRRSVEAVHPILNPLEHRRRNDPLSRALPHIGR
jgi:hypothetical protein